MAPKWSYNGAMTVSLSIKGVPVELAKALKERAEQNHRSLQGELMFILKAAVEQPKPFRARELALRIKALGFSTPADGTAIIRHDRDRRR